MQVTADVQEIAKLLTCSFIDSEGNKSLPPIKCVKGECKKCGETKVRKFYKRLLEINDTVNVDEWSRAKQMQLVRYKTEKKCVSTKKNTVIF